MSQENVHLVRSIMEAWERGDYRSVDWAHPDIEFVIAGLPDAGTWMGVDGMIQGWSAVLGAWAEHRVEADEYRELDGDRILVFGRFLARGKTSGLDVEQMRTEGVNLFHIRDGKVARLVIYFDRDRALADVGLPAEADDQM